MSHAPGRLGLLAGLWLGLISWSSEAAAQQQLPPVRLVEDAVVFQDARSLTELGVVKTGQQYTRIKVDGTRSAIRWKGQQLGWLEQRALQEITSEVYLVMSPSNTSVRAQPQDAASALGTLPLGASVAPLAMGGEWVKINFAGQEGFLKRTGLAGPISQQRAAQGGNDTLAAGFDPNGIQPAAGAAAPAGAGPLPGNASPGNASPGASAIAPAQQQQVDPGQQMTGGTRRGPQSANNRELEVMARIIKGEALQCSFEGKVAVGAVILNRVRSSKFPNDIISVCHQPSQFSCYNPQFRARLYNGPVPEECFRAAREALAGNDPVNGADHYYNPYLVRPSWARNMVLVRRIGTNRTNTHDFFRSR